jgi:tetratricopeptide (TPR) repeat protein
VSQRRKPPNHLLREARRRLPSPSGSGRPMSRQELADGVNAYLASKDDERYQREATLDANHIGKLERGEHRWLNDMRREAFRHVLKAATDTELGFYITRGLRSASAEPPEPGVASQPGVSVTDTDPATLKVQVELLREGLNDALSEGTMAEASLDDWERTVIRHGRATRDRPAGVLLDDLSADLAELKRALHRHRSASALRRLTRVAAHMSGLMCLTFCKLDDRQAFRRWARTARLAADEAGDSVTHSWILAQQAYGHYYSGDLDEATDVARHAQAVVRRPCVGAALAAALEARAHAAMGSHQDTREALGRAEDILSHLGADALIPSAFGYNEAQLRFHAGNAYTHLGDVKAALREQDRALELCMPGDYTDWAMTRLDRATCLIHDGITNDALAYATETMTSLIEPQRQGIITLRGHEILSALPKAQQALPAARELRELLMPTPKEKEVEGA